MFLRVIFVSKAHSIDQGRVSYWTLINFWGYFDHTYQRNPQTDYYWPDEHYFKQSFSLSPTEMWWRMEGQYLEQIRWKIDWIGSAIEEVSSNHTNVFVATKPCQMRSSLQVQQIDTSLGQSFTLLCISSDSRHLKTNEPLSRYCYSMFFTIKPTVCCWALWRLIGIGRRKPAPKFLQPPGLKRGQLRRWWTTPLVVVNKLQVSCSHRLLLQYPYSVRPYRSEKRSLCENYTRLWPHPTAWRNHILRG